MKNNIKLISYVMYSAFILLLLIVSVVKNENHLVFLSIITAIFLGLYLLSVDFKRASIASLKLAMLDFMPGLLLSSFLAYRHTDTTVGATYTILAFTCVYAFFAKGWLKKIIVTNVNEK